MNEEFEKRWERKAEFIVNQQAQFAADIQRLQEAQAQTEQRLARAAETAQHAAEAVDHVAGVVAQSVEHLNNLTTVTLEGFQALTESQILTDEKLQNLIVTVDRHIKAGHRGQNGAQN